jgi:hypothetical protein
MAVKIVFDDGKDTEKFISEGTSFNLTTELLIVFSNDGIVKQTAMLMTLDPTTYSAPRQVFACAAKRVKYVEIV